MSSLQRSSQFCAVLTDLKSVSIEYQDFQSA